MNTHFDQAARAALEAAGVDASALEKLAAPLRSGSHGVRIHPLQGEIAPPEPGDLLELPSSESERERLASIGRTALARGEVGIALLTGGMATRFGGAVKAEVDVVRGVSFLEAKLRDASRAARDAGGVVHVLAMTSFATHARVSALLERRPGLGLVRAFAQGHSARLDVRGDLVLDDDGKPSLYATGHGDLTFALRSSGTLAAFTEAGGRYLLMSNVDNIGATLDPLLLGMHIARATPLTIEVVRKHGGDKGGAPARVGGRTRLVESFRFPADFDQNRIHVFNTNTIWIDAHAIDRDFELEWHAVEKVVDDQRVIQFERLVGELTAILPTTYVVVPREGVVTRFLPVKEVSDLAARASELEGMLEARGLLTDG
jgi:UTP--glucose-1-phosphate uridylyltransferase